MGDEEEKPKAEASDGRTIRIDALTDVELLDHAAAVDDDDERESAAPAAAPPPLPKKAPPARTGLKIAGIVVALGAGVLCALAIVHFVFPAPAAPPAPEAAASPAAVRHVHMDDELVIRTGTP